MGATVNERIESRLKDVGLSSNAASRAIGRQD